MRILLVASAPESDLVRNTTEALLTAGHTVLPGMQSCSPEVVVAFGSGSASRAAQAFPGVPLAVYLESGGSIPAGNTGRKFLSVFQFRSHRDKAGASQRGKTTVIPPPVMPVNSHLRWSADSRAVILPGPFDHGCGHRTFFKALSLLPEENIAFIWGEKGDYSAEDIFEIASEEGVSGRVSFFRPLSFCTVYASVFPHLTGESDYEFLGGVMNPGIPLLLSSAGFHRDLIKDGVTGLFHSPGNHRQLAGQMDHLMHNRGLSGYLSGNAAEYCRNELSPEAVGRKWTEELEQLCSG